jgi:hypothetical protein
MADISRSYTDLFLLLLRDGMTLSGCLGDLVTVRASVDLAESALVQAGNPPAA